MKDLTKFLDPSGLGVISFEDFHRGISAISNGGEINGPVSVSDLQFVVSLMFQFSLRKWSSLFCFLHQNWKIFMTALGKKQSHSTDA